MAMKVMRIKQDQKMFGELNSRIQTLSRAMQDETPTKDGYSFYRARIYSYETLTNGDGIAIECLCTNADGNFRVLSFLYDGENQSFPLTYVNDSAARFMNEDRVKEGIRSVIELLMSMSISISNLYFDFVSEDLQTALVSCNIIEDYSGDDEHIMFASAGAGFHNQYYINEAMEICRGTCLSANWIEIVTIINNLNKAAQDKTWTEKCNEKVKGLEEFYGIIYRK